METNRINMHKTILSLCLLFACFNQVQSQVVPNFENPCNYAVLTPSKYNANFTEYGVYSVSSDFEEKIYLRYYLSDYTVTNYHTSYTSTGSYTSSSTKRPRILSLELHFKHINTPEKNYKVEVVFNDGKKLKKRMSHKTFNQKKFPSWLDTEKTECCTVSISLSKRNLDLFRNSTIKEIRINGETRVIETEQALAIQMGAECMSTNNIFSQPAKPKEKKRKE